MSPPAAQIEMLRRAWEKTRRGRGGAAALAGFSYQLALTLNELLLRPPTDRTGAFLAEAVSDIAATEGRSFVVAQVKLTLGSEAMRRALDELWEDTQSRSCRDAKSSPAFVLCDPLRTSAARRSGSCHRALVTI